MDSTVQCKNTAKNKLKTTSAHKIEKSISDFFFYYLCLARCENVHEISHLAFPNKFSENVSTLYAETFNNTITSKPLSAWFPSLNTKENACQVLKEIVYLHLKIH